MAKVVITPKAFQDLEEIQTFIARDNEETARKYVDQILKKLEGLSEHAHLGISLKRKWGIPTSYHFIICQTHLALYKIEGDFVRVYRVLHGKQDYLAILGLEKEPTIS